MQAHNATVRTPSALGAAPNALGRAPIVLGRGSYCIRKAPNVLLQNVLGRAPNACASRLGREWHKALESMLEREVLLAVGQPSMSFMQASVVVNAPVDSQTYSTPVDFHGISVGRRVADSDTFAPLMRRPASPSTAQVPEKRSCTVLCSSRYFMYSGAIGELMCLRTNDSRSTAMRTTWRPMRPKPLTPSLIGKSAPSGWDRPRAC